MTQPDDAPLGERPLEAADPARADADSDPLARPGDTSWSADVDRYSPEPEPRFDWSRPADREGDPGGR
ncbi:MAG TPA: hypothetical protein VEY67_11850, partial [Candidatus Dormibacteraeota bacterium]|nr:hypothetical protein [Candidatus Dormibacteraeota bacterium]